MRFEELVLARRAQYASAASWLVIGVLFGATPSYSQQAQESGESDRESIARDDTGQPDAIEEIVVTGLQERFRRAQSVKRDAGAVVDALVPTNLGRFSDQAISDALQRIPGVQIQRNDGGQEGDRVSVRGLGPKFVETTINGRTALSSGTEALTNLRAFNFEVIPSELISGIIVKKMPTASDVSHGVAGLVDVQTREPLDASNYTESNDVFFGNVGLESNIDSIRDKVGWEANALFGGRFADDRFGFYIGGLNGKSFPGRDQLFPQVLQSDIQFDNNGDGAVDQVRENVFVVNDIDFEPIREERERSSVYGALEWQATENLNILVDGIYTSVDNVSIRNRLAPVFGPALRNTVFEPDEINIDETNTLQSVELGSLDSPVTNVFIPFLFGNRTEISVSGVNFDYQPTADLSIELDLHHSGVDYRQDLSLPIFLQDVPGEQVEFNTNNGLFSADLGPIPLDGFTLPQGSALIRNVFMQGDEFGYDIDFEKQLRNFGPLTSFEWGARWTRADVESIRTNIRDIADDDLSQSELDAFADQIIDQNDRSDFGFFPDKNVLANEFPLGSLSTAEELIPGLQDTVTGGKSELIQRLGVDPASSFEFVEDVIALYAQTDLEGEILGLPYTGNIGIRVINAQLAGEGARVNQDGSITPTSATNDYWQPLPSANIRLSLVRDVLALRLGAARSITRPNPSDLVPREAANQPSSPGDIPTGRRGNPLLEPVKTWSLDTTFEWFHDYNGAVFVSLFYKEVRDFIFPITTRGTLPGQGDEIFDIREPLNFTNGDVKGFEVTVNQPFTFLPSPFDGFGLNFNYTFVDTQFGRDVGDAGFGFPGSSKNNWNLTTYYEKGPIGLRMAVVSRDDFFRNLPGQGAQQENATAVFSEGTTRFAFNATYDVLERVSLFVDVSNAFQEGRRDFLRQEDTFNGAFRRPRTITFGVKGTL